VKARVRKRLRNSKRRLQHRLRRRQWPDQRRRLFPDRNIHDDVPDKVRGSRFSGLGTCWLLAQRLGLAEALDASLHMLKRHLVDPRRRQAQVGRVAGLAAGPLAGGLPGDPSGGGGSVG
jgi:hypothetical protein